MILGDFWFRAERRNWVGLANADGIDALEGNNTSSSENLHDFPITWSRLVKIRDLVEAPGNLQRLSLETASGENLTTLVEPGPVEMHLHESTDWETGNDYWQFARWNLITLVDVPENHSPEDRVVFFPDNPMPLFWDIPDNPESLRLTPLDLVEPDELLAPASDGSPPWLFADSFLLESLRKAVIDMPTKPRDLPLPTEYLRLNAVVVDELNSGKNCCIGLEIWVSMGKKEKLLARRTDGVWSYGYGHRWLDLAFDNNQADPQYVMVDLPTTQIQIDLERAQEFIQLFDSDQSISRQAVMLFSDPPGRLIASSDLPDEILALGRHVLKTNRRLPGVFPRGPASPVKVVQGVVEDGLSSRLDTFISALFACWGQGRSFQDSELERDWRRTERTLSEKASVTHGEKWSTVQIQITPTAGLGPLPPGDIAFVEFNFLQNPLRCEFEIFSRFHPFIKRDQRAKIVTPEMKQDFEEILRVINVDALDRLGFERVHSDFYVRPFLEPLRPESLARLVLRCLRECTPIEMGFEVNVGGSSPSGSRGFDFSVP